ncbi:MAG: hypothetical protein V3T88_04725 [Nitrosomonadaceae bacterium]
MKIIGIILIIILAFCVKAEAIYDQDYLVYDEYGLKQVNCMRCNTPIKERTIRLSRVSEGRNIYIESVRSLSNFAAVPVVLSDGSWTNILMDRDCAKAYRLTEEEKEGMAEQLKNGWIGEARGLKRSQEEIDGIKDRVKKTKVIRHRFEEKKEKPLKEKRVYDVQKRPKVKGRN